MQLSIVVPVRNRIKNIQNFFRSVLHNKGIDFEVILVDYGSTDSTLKWMQTIQHHADKLRIITVTEPVIGINLSKARNIGVKEAKAPIIYTLDCDVKLIRQDALSWILATYKSIAFDLVLNSGMRSDGLILETVGWGCSVFTKKMWEEVGGFPNYIGNYGYEDFIFRDLICYNGGKAVGLWDGKYKRKNIYFQTLKIRKVSDRKAKEHGFPKEKSQWEHNSQNTVSAYEEFKKDRTKFSNKDYPLPAYKIIK